MTGSAKAIEKKEKMNTQRGRYHCTVIRFFRNQEGDGKHTGLGNKRPRSPPTHTHTPLSPRDPKTLGKVNMSSLKGNG